MFFSMSSPVGGDRGGFMARILSIDYGGRRTGLAVTDPLQIIATGLETIDSKELIPWLKKYFLQEDVELIIIGLPKNWDESDTHGTPLVQAAIKKIQKEFPAMPLKTVDERYSSKMAKDAMIEMGMKKKDRRDKKNVDLIAATIILQEYLGQL
jgi:putative Holliday junction resolvase